MPSITPVQVVCSLQDRETLRTVTTALRADRVHAVGLPWPEVIREAESSVNWQALIYDLCPWDDSATTVIDSFRKRIPAGPILLYPPPRQDVGRHLEVQLRRPCVCLRLQSNNGHEKQDLRNDTRRMLALIPCNRLALIVRNAVPAMPERLLAYVEEALQTLRGEGRTGRLLVYNVATRIGTSARTLERVADMACLPKPKELLDWLLLLYVTFVVQEERTTWSGAARRVGMRTKTLYRMRHRLLPTKELDERPCGRQVYTTSLDGVLAAFARRCKGSRAAVDHDADQAAV